MSLSVGNNVLLIGTENCNVVRWNVETDEFEGAWLRDALAVHHRVAVWRRAEIVVSKKPEDKIHKVTAALHEIALKLCRLTMCSGVHGSDGQSRAGVADQRQQLLCALEEPETSGARKN